MTTNVPDVLPESFDYIVVGTGLVESILAGAFARVGYSVLHIDRNDHYGGTHASFNLRAFQKLAEQNEEAAASALSETVISEGEVAYACPSQCSLVCDMRTHYNVSQFDATTSPMQAQPQLDPNESHSIVIGPETVPVTNAVNGITDDEQDVQSDANTILLPEQNTNQLETDMSNIHFETESNQIQNETSPTDTISSSNVNSSEQGHSSTPANTSVSSSLPEVSAGSHSAQTSEEYSSAASVQQEHPSRAWSILSIENEWRRFNIDLSPRVLYCRGDLVELLISSDVGKYCEFRPVDRVLTVHNETIKQVPCSRADVFTSQMTVIEKRMLMRFLQFCLDFDETSQRMSEIQDDKFCDFLRRRNLSDIVQHYVFYAIAMATPETTTIAGLIQTKKFFKSLGRYGNTAFLWPLYGSGEIPQCFARLCAVFGGVYCLRTSVTSVIVDSSTNECEGVLLSNGQRVACRWLVMESSSLPTGYLSQQINERYISRAVLMCDKPLFGTDENHVQLLHLPCPENAECPITVLQLTASAMVCPRDMCLVHLTRRHITDPETDLSYAVSQLFQHVSETGTKPNILWSCYFKMVDTSSVHTTQDTPSNVICVGGAGAELHSDDCVIKAREIFNGICPNEEFLPRTPNPEDIVYDFGGAGASEGVANGPVDGVLENGLPGGGGDSQQH